MARGKRFSDDDDKDFYSSNNQENDFKPNNSYFGKLNIEDDKEIDFKSNNVKFRGPDQYFEDDYDEEDDDYDDEESGISKKAMILFAIVLVIMLVLAGFKMFGNDAPTNEVDTNTTTNTIVDNNSMISTLSGYSVLGKIKIDKLSIEQYILDSKEDGALQSGVTKLYGGSINNYGNFCIAGHNYEGVFKDLDTLSIGDKITIIDKRNAETEYKVVSKSECAPDDLKCLEQNEDKIEITLITCDSAGTKRTIVKAELADTNEN